MSDLNATIQRVIELDKQATGGPWMLSGSEPDDTVRVDMATKPYHRITADANETRTRKANCTLIAEYRTAAPELARALIETQAALAAAEEGRLAALDIAKGAYEERDALRLELQAANARADAAEETGDAAERDADRYQSDRDALELRCDGLNADLARVTAERDKAQSKATSLHTQLQMMNPIVSAAVDRAEKAESDLATAREQAETLRRERDEARGQMAVERRQRERCEQEIAEAATLRESVRELVDGLRFAKDHLVDTHDCDETTTIDALLAKHAAPAPTPADAKEDDRG